MIEILELDIDMFRRVQLFEAKKNAENRIQDFNNTALAMGGKKRAVKKHMEPYFKILNTESNPDIQAAKDTARFMKKFSGGI